MSDRSTNKFLSLIEKNIFISFICVPLIVFISLKLIWLFPYDEVGSKEGWLSFLGGYCGVCGAFIAANLQIKEQRKLFDEQLKKEQRKEQLGSLKILQHYLIRIEKNIFILEKFFIKILISETQSRSFLLTREEIEKLGNHLNNLGTYEYYTEAIKVIEWVNIIENLVEDSLVIHQKILKNFKIYIKQILENVAKEDLNKINDFFIGEDISIDEVLTSIQIGKNKLKDWNMDSNRKKEMQEYLSGVYKWLTKINETINEKYFEQITENIKDILSQINGNIENLNEFSK